MVLRPEQFQEGYFTDARQQNNRQHLLLHLVRSLVRCNAWTLNRKYQIIRTPKLALNTFYSLINILF